MFVSTRRPPLSTASPSRVRDAKLRSLRGMCDTLEALVESLSVRNRPLILALSRAIAYPVLVLWTHSLAERAHYVTVGGETAPSLDNHEPFAIAGIGLFLPSARC